jgi:hypothetical protein
MGRHARYFVFIGRLHNFPGKSLYTLPIAFYPGMWYNSYEEEREVPAMVKIIAPDHRTICRCSSENTARNYATMMSRILNQVLEIHNDEVGYIVRVYPNGMSNIIEKDAEST